MIKLPPKAKIYEAYSCLANKRIEIKENEAIVKSSDYNKKYIVKWLNNNYSSTDNASFWQGYPGYPILAVLMLQEKISYNKEIANLFKDINWHELNDKYKRDYDKAVSEVLNSIEFDTKNIQIEADKAYEELKNLDINIKRKI